MSIKKIFFAEAFLCSISLFSMKPNGTAQSLIVLDKKPYFFDKEAISAKIKSAKTVRDLKEPLIYLLKTAVYCSSHINWQHMDSDMACADLFCH